MAKVTGYTAIHMDEIKNNTVKRIYINGSQNVIVEKFSGEEVDVGNVSAVAKLEVVDTDSVDMVLSGAGTSNAPWKISAKTKELTVQGLLDPAYQGQGPARVTFLPGSNLSSDYYQWIGKYERWGNRVVELIRAGTSWRILGHTGHTTYGGKVALHSSLGSNYMPHNVRSSSNEYNEPRVQRLPSGIVVLSGLLASRGAGVDDELILTLPAGYRPDATMIFPVDNVGTPRTVIVKTNGEVRWIGPFTASDGGPYTSLDGIAFPAAGVATWSNITEWTNNWAPWNTTEYKPGYWKDPYGVVWFKGLVTGGAKSADAVMFKLPSAYTPPVQTHNVASTDKGLGYVSAYPTTQGGGGDRGVAWKLGNPSDAGWLSLCGVRVITSEAFTLYPWNRGVPTGNGWETSYTSQFAPLSVTRRPDGLAMSDGLVRAGNAEAPIANFQDWILPEKRTILRGVGADKSRRIDIIGMTQGWTPDRTRGQAYASGTHEAWTSFDGLVWMVGD